MFFRAGKPTTPSLFEKRPLVFTRSLQTRSSTSTNHAHAVLSAELIWLAKGALRIVAPLAVHQQAIGITPRRERNGGLPQAALEFLEGDGCLLPAGKITRNQDCLRLRRVEREGHFLFCVFFLCHKSRSFWRNNSASRCEAA